jgi:DMSO/TMAO reductase YedYZ heme-binding membrane subunit
VYFAVPLSLLHYFWLERDIWDWVFVYLFLVIILFIIRIPAVRQAITRRGQKPQRIASETKEAG